MVICRVMFGCFALFLLGVGTFAEAQISVQGWRDPGSSMAHLYTGQLIAPGRAHTHYDTQDVVGEFNFVSYVQVGSFQRVYHSIDTAGDLVGYDDWNVQLSGGVLCEEYADLGCSGQIWFSFRWPMQ